MASGGSWSDLCFCAGLIMVIIGGAELFTGNNLLVMAWASNKVTTGAVLLNWDLSFVGNFVGAIATAALMFYTTQYTFGGGSVVGGIEYRQRENLAGVHSALTLASCATRWSAWRSGCVSVLAPTSTG
jgi:formate/nitrite transporter FocA (FNT family)